MLTKLMLVKNTVQFDVCIPSVVNNPFYLTLNKLILTIVSD